MTWKISKNLWDMGLDPDSSVKYFKQVIEIMKKIYEVRLWHYEMKAKQILYIVCIIK